MNRLTLAPLLLLAQFVAAEPPLDIGSRRELFVDHYLIDQLKGASLRLHAPQLAPPTSMPRPDGHYATIIKDGNLYRFYCRGDKLPGISWRTHGLEAYHENEVTLYAESRDGINWTHPNLGLHTVERYPAGNVVLADAFLVNHNFTPFLDTRPGVPADQRYKAIGGLAYQPHQKDVRAKRGPGGLVAFTSADGIRWRRLRDQAVVPEEWGAYFDSQNVAFWSESEGVYVCYFRRFEQGLRAISRTTSKDFVTWTPPVPMNANVPGEHLYTSGVHPYFRAPHIYIALPTRFLPARSSTTDILLMTSRGGGRFDRTFMDAFIRPGLDKDAWGNRSNYAALNVVPTGDAEMSIYVTGGRRYTLRIDGFVSVNAPYAGGEMLTRVFTFNGRALELNCSTSAGGIIRVEIQDVEGRPLPGVALDDCQGIVGDTIRHVVRWKQGSDVSALAGRPVRLRFVAQDADLYSMRFE